METATGDAVLQDVRAQQENVPTIPAALVITENNEMKLKIINIELLQLI